MSLTLFTKPSPSLIILIIAITTFLVYYHGKKKNIGLVRIAIQNIEQKFLSFDKNYQWIGGLSGFQARLKNSNVHLDILFLLLPRHSLFYFPFSKLLRHGDWLNIKLVFGSNGKREELSALIEKVKKDRRLLLREYKVCESCYLYLSIVLKKNSHKLLEEIFLEIYKIVS